MRELSAVQSLGDPAEAAELPVALAEDHDLAQALQRIDNLRGHLARTVPDLTTLHLGPALR